ncbi:hypothetical protein OS493_006231 [Desmophyllum pertusum]|uniref:Uncharacterized protein n=1 Tax=Desmophyllum pertusum TaxID=174260 RepID=A0A9X0A4H7_9CNID|nr:hypothetical protein OS493_006231 [Desmophyllum pertusum]
MQTSDLNSSVIPQRLIAQHQQCSPGIDHLIQKAEFENSEQVRLIETEKQQYAALLRQLDEKTRQTEELEKSTTQLDEEAKQLHKHFTQNREICERLENQSVLAKYEAIWDRYKKQYESKANAKELTKIKKDAMKDKEELETIRSKVHLLETGISSMEKEKKNIEESVEKGITSAIPVIIRLYPMIHIYYVTVAPYTKVVQRVTKPKLLSFTTRRAQLNLETRKAEDSVQEITTKIENSKEEQACKSTEEESQTNKAPLQDVPPGTPLRTPMTASLQLASPHIDHRAPIQTQSDADMEVESNIDRNMTKPQHDAALLDRCSSEQLPVTSNQQSRRFTDNQTSDECYIQPHLQNSSDALDKSGYSVTKSPSHHHEEGTVFPTTPTSAGQGFTPSSEVTNSPFNFEMHSDMIQQLTKSPGDGFLFQSRPMFDHSPMDTERDQVNTENAPFLFNMQETRNIPGPTG